MGSVGDNYRCPTCGRTGMGGYALDGINYPICTAGNHSCLWRVLEQGASPTDILAQGLFAIIGNKEPVFTPEFVRETAKFLCPRSS